MHLLLLFSVLLPLVSTTTKAFIPTTPLPVRTRTIMALASSSSSNQYPQEAQDSADKARRFSSSTASSKRPLSPPPTAQRARSWTSTPLIEWSLRRVGTTPAIDLLESALEERGQGSDLNGEDDGLFTAALKECRSIGDGKRALRYLGIMKHRHMREIDVVSTIHACAAEGLTDDAIGTFRRLAEMKREQGRVISFGSPSYVAIIMACSKGNRPDDALAFFQEMGVGGIPPPDAACYAAMMETYRRYGRATDALALLDNMKVRGMVEGHSRAAPRGLHLVLAATIRALTDLGRAGEALERFELALDGSSGIIPDGGCFAAALEAVADLGNWRRALGLIEEMGREVEYINSRGVFLRRQLRVGRQHYVAVLRACAKAGEAEQALEILQDMQTRGSIRPDEKCYRWALFACCKGGQWGRAFDMLMEEEQPPLSQIPWTLPCYTTTMRALVNVGEGPRVLTLWEKLLARGLAPDAATGDIALSMAGKEKNWEAAEAIFAVLTSRGMEPYVAGVGVVLEGLCQQGRLDEARELLRQVSVPNVIMYTSLLSAMGRVGDVTGALALLEEMETEAGITPDHVALTCLVDACLKAGKVEDAVRLAARLETTSAMVGGVKRGKGKGGGRPQEDEKSFGVRVLTLLEQGQWEAAWRSIQEAETAAGHVPVPAMSYSVLVNAAAKEGRWQDAVDMLLHMREKRGLEPSTVDLSSAINACRMGGEVGMALKLLEVLKIRRQEYATAKSQGRKGGKGGKGRGKKGEDSSKKMEKEQGLQQSVVEEEEAHDPNPYQVSYGLVLDLLAKQLSSSSSASSAQSSSS
ncbi:pentatricopeptide repeat containining protein [Nannochloropsis oceanica]